MKLKMIIAAIGVTLSAASQATIVPPSTIGGSDLLLNVWEQNAPGGQPDQSFTLNLGVTFSQFEAASGSSATLATLLSTDSIWTNFLATSDTADAGVLQWSVIASGVKVNTRPGIFGTATVGTDPTTVGIYGYLVNANLNSANTQVAGTVANLNIAANPDEQVAQKGSGAYYMDYTLSDFNGTAFQNSNDIGATAAVWSAKNISGGNTVAAQMTQMAGTMTFTQVGSDYVLSYNVAAVPEAPGFGMALCGLAAVGFLSARRRKA